ncbi:hypothetical protein [Streptomyces sp. PanSC9]|uniref:hypothetical protein n=1 Tax=Streptomyces sp. PanSC9 TaxID=1520461 RepID=UPI000F489B1F|nr:hypothetical protein [Streptomyces sp. PanSC9]ROP55475.1 hypothetical protein EDD94_5031 [Streptomyces sp. PanSC9]
MRADTLYEPSLTLVSVRSPEKPTVTELSVPLSSQLPKYPLVRFSAAAAPPPAGARKDPVPGRITDAASAFGRMGT